MQQTGRGIACRNVIQSLPRIPGNRLKLGFNGFNSCHAGTAHHMSPNPTAQVVEQERISHQHVEDTLVVVVSGTGD